MQKDDGWIALQNDRCVTVCVVGKWGVRRSRSKTSWECWEIGQFIKLGCADVCPSAATRRSHAPHSHGFFRKARCLGWGHFNAVIILISQFLVFSYFTLQVAHRCYMPLWLECIHAAFDPTLLGSRHMSLTASICDSVGRSMAVSMLWI